MKQTRPAIRLQSGICRAFFAVALIVLGISWSAPGRAQRVPASFDCAKAERVVDRFICVDAVLRWRDLAMSRSYAAAKAAAAGPARDELVLSQRDWVRERDRRCIADRSFKELIVPSSALRNQAYSCLDTVYLDRRRTLQDLALKPLVSTGVARIDLKPIATARPEVVVESVRIAGIRISPDSSMLAILLPSQEIDLPDQVWLYRVADGKLVAATPKPDQEQAHPDGSPMAIHALAWQGDTLYARVAIWNKNDTGEQGATVVYAATMDGNHQLDKVPVGIKALLDAEAQPGAMDQDEMAESEGDIPEAARGSGDFLAWVQDLGHGTLELRVRKRVPGLPAYLVAWGSWKLWSYLLDANRSQLVYSADAGLTVFDMVTHGERRIAGTSREDTPYAISADRRLFVWSTRNQCGDELLTAQDETKPEYFCLAYLSKPQERQ